jgi:hypothetical protein
MTDNMKALFAKFPVIRYMDYSGTNCNQQREWSDRTEPDDWSQHQLDYEGGYEWAGRGGAWEYVILFSNETQVSPWINIPLHASDDYVRRLATLFRDGNQWTRGLDGNLKLYVEYSNEVWNTAGGFCGRENIDLALAEVAAGVEPRLDFDGLPATRSYPLGHRRVGKRAAQISEIFREVFGDAVPASPWIARIDDDFSVFGVKGRDRLGGL